MSRLPLLAALLLQAVLPAPARAQAASADSARVVATVERYIAAMTDRDTSYLRAATLPGATFVPIVVPAAPGATPSVRATDAFIAGIGQSTRRFLGRVWTPRVSVEGPIAVFVAPYDAHFDGVFSHCGIDHYILARVGDRWLVSQLIWTVQRAGCPWSPLGPPG